ncbi:MAG: hypothetical protein NTX86_02715 [Candidatus Dependentiae bacterium]|nr:hypothetical protein [Candidatus Dependentiae bacterium]
MVQRNIVAVAFLMLATHGLSNAMFPANKPNEGAKNQQQATSGISKASAAATVAYVAWPTTTAIVKGGCCLFPSTLVVAGAAVAAHQGYKYFTQQKSATEKK